MVVDLLTREVTTQYLGGRHTFEDLRVLRRSKTTFLRWMKADTSGNLLVIDMNWITEAGNKWMKSYDNPDLTCGKEFWHKRTKEAYLV